ncbi:hypothetical protein PTKIN_Ptkin13bG0228100 [Pterospermum kingtungense]
MQRHKAESPQSSTPPKKPRLSLHALASSMWSCPSKCSHSSDALGGDHKSPSTVRKETLAGILALKEKLESGKPIRGVVIEPLNIKILPPCDDCQYTGYNLDDLRLQVAKAGSSTDHHVSVPVPVSEAEEAGDSVPLGGDKYSHHPFELPCCKELPSELKQLFKQAWNGPEENKPEVASAHVSEKKNSNSKL